MEFTENQVQEIVSKAVTEALDRYRTTTQAPSQVTVVKSKGPTEVDRRAAFDVILDNVYNDANRSIPSLFDRKRATQFKHLGEVATQANFKGRPAFQTIFPDADPNSSPVAVANAFTKLYENTLRQRLSEKEERVSKNPGTKRRGAVSFGSYVINRFTSDAKKSFITIGRRHEEKCES